MATDLFGKYYNNPNKSYIYTNMLCNGESADEISFDIDGSLGTITNGSETLASIDLSDVHVGLTDFTNDMKTLQPYSMMYVRGITGGSSYMRRGYCAMPETITNNKYWQFTTKIEFRFKYTGSDGFRKDLLISAKGDIIEETSFIEIVNDLLAEQKIPVVMTYTDGVVYLTSQQIGFEFWCRQLDFTDFSEEDLPKLNTVCDEELLDGVNVVDRSEIAADDNWSNSDEVLHDDSFINGEAGWDDESSNEYQHDGISSVYHNNKFYLFESCDHYVPAVKYKNGAMKGTLIKVTYPEYHADGIGESMRSIKIGFLVDRVNDFFVSRTPEYSNSQRYYKILKDIDDQYSSKYEIEVYNQWACRYPAHNEWIAADIDFDHYDNSYVDPADIEYKHTMNNHNFMMRTDRIKDDYDVMGLYGYATYLSKFEKWQNIGQMYCATAAPDDPSADTKNLISSFILYNPNPFPVIVKYMTFA